MAPEKRRQLEQILHPPIRRHWSPRSEKASPIESILFADIPLLYETGGEKLCDRGGGGGVLGGDPNAAPDETRSGLDRNAAEAIIAAQMPLSEKIKLA